MSAEPELQWCRIDSFVGNTTSASLTMHRPCPVCGGLRSRQLFCFEDFQFFSDSASVPKRATVRQAQCHSCAAIYMDPCYSGVGFGYLFPEAGQSYGAISERPVEQVQWLKDRGLLRDGLVFLDVGCYEGTFLRALPDAVKKLGVDIDEPAVARGNRRHGGSGVRLFCGPLETFHIPETPDVISMYHVLEHVAQPLEVLKHLRAVSHATTKFVVEVPVLEYGATNDLNGFFAVQHMTHFSLASLTRLVRRAGWGIVEAQKIEGYNGYRLLLTPGDVVEGHEGAASDQVEASRYMAQWYAAQVAVSDRMAGLGSADRWVIWGAGFHTEVLYQLTPFFAQHPNAEFVIVDSDASKHGKSWRGIPIYPTDVVSTVDWQNTRLLVSSYGSQEVIRNVAIERGVPQDRVGCLYDHVTAY